jgi:predicted GNAT family acetyltransferase
MIVKEYENAHKFLEDYKAVLLEREAVSQLLLYSACQEENLASNRGSIFGAVLKDNTAILLYCIVPEYGLLLYPSLQDEAVEAVTLLADFLAEKKIKITGVIAKLELCQSFIEQYKKQVNITFLQKLGTDIMEIRKVNEIKPTEGIQRLALPEDAKLVADWMLRFQMEALLSELDYEAALKNAEALIEEEKIYLYEITGHTVVSMAIAARKLLNGIAITYIYTPEEYRGNGYAAANIYYLSKALLEQGQKFCTIFVDKNNQLSIRAYEKVGYQILDDNYEFKTLELES